MFISVYKPAPFLPLTLWTGTGHVREGCTGDLDTPAFTDTGGTTSLAGMSKEFRVGRAWAGWCGRSWDTLVWFVILVECPVAEDSLPPGSGLYGLWTRTKTLRLEGPAGCLLPPFQAAPSSPLPHGSALDQKIPDSLKY